MPDQNCDWCGESLEDGECPNMSCENSPYFEWYDEGLDEVDMEESERPSLNEQHAHEWEEDRRF